MNPYKKLANKLWVIIGIWIIINAFVHQPVLAEGNVFDYVNQGNKEPLQSEQEEQDPEVDAGEDLFAENSSQNMFMLIVKIIIYLLLILAMIYGLIKFLAIRQRKIGHHQLFQTLGGTPLGHNRSLQLVKVGGNIYLLGVAEQVSLIKEITNPQEIEAIYRDLEEQESIISKSFKSLLASKLEASKADKVDQSYQSKLNRSLDNLKHQREAFKEEIREKNKEGSLRD